MISITCLQCGSDDGFIWSDKYICCNRCENLQHLEGVAEHLKVKHLLILSKDTQKKMTQRGRGR